MAKSRIGGIYGLLSGSVGSVTYSKSRTNRKGVQYQVVRQKITDPKISNTVPQILQRMKLGPAQRFYAAFEQAVANGIMSHSWESVDYGSASRQEFMSRAMKNDAAVFVPKGVNYFVPGEYEVSEGSLPSLPWRENMNLGSSDTYTVIGGHFNENRALTDASVQALIGIGVPLGAQITCLYVRYDAEVGRYTPFVSRLVNKVGELPVYTGQDWYVSANLDEGQFFVSDGEQGDSGAAALAIIVSTGTDAATDARSTEQMLLLGEFKNLISGEAMQAAIDSYLNNTTVNEFNSEWYLNNGTSQAFNGQVGAVDLIATSGELEMDDRFLVGQTLEGSTIKYHVVTADGTANGQGYIVDNSNKVVAATYGNGSGETPATVVKGSELASALTAAGMLFAGYVKYSEAIAEQGGFTPAA